MSLDLSNATVRGSLTYEQAAPYYRLINHAASVDRGRLCEAASAGIEAAQEDSERFSLFADLLKSPERWQGRPVRLTGHINKLTRVPAGENDAGIDAFYEAWLVSADSQRYPSVVILADVPDGVPLGETLIDGVTVCGYLFKLHAYPARDGKGRLAPMIMAGTFDWSPAPQVRPLLSPTGTLVAAGLVVAAVVVGLVAISRRPRRRLPAEPFDADAIAFDETPDDV